MIITKKKKNPNSNISNKYVTLCTFFNKMKRKKVMLNQSMLNTKVANDDEP